MSKKQKTRALCLLSGGLDSILMIKVLQEQGVECTGITFVSPFFGSKNAEHSAKELGVPIIIVDITKELLKIVKKPRFGHGRYMNPCIDCHALMIREAGRIMKRQGFDLIATGEVLGERPMSQNKQSLMNVARHSGVAQYILRPLSAKLLPPTKPENEGKVDRDKLLDIEGRSRKPQMKLAHEFGIKKYIQPAGGCLLTDPRFSDRLRDLLKHDPRAREKDVRLLRLGRHFRLPGGAKVIVGRDEKDNEGILAHYKKGRVLIISDIVPGPIVLLIGSKKKTDIELAARLAASHADNEGREVDMELRIDGKRKRIAASPSPRSEFQKMQI